MSRTDTGAERLSEFGVMSTEIIQAETQRASKSIKKKRITGAPE